LRIPIAQPESSNTAARLTIRLSPKIAGRDDQQIG
jgi:hypothetical protein